MDKVSNYQEIGPNFIFSQKSYFSEYNWNFLLDQMLRPYKFYGTVTCKESTVFIFACYEPLRSADPLYAYPEACAFCMNLG